MGLHSYIVNVCGIVWQGGNVLFVCVSGTGPGDGLWVQWRMCPWQHAIKVMSSSWLECGLLFPAVVCLSKCWDYNSHLWVDMCWAGLCAASVCSANTKHQTIVSVSGWQLAAHTKPHHTQRRQKRNYKLLLVLWRNPWWSFYSGFHVKW